MSQTKAQLIDPVDGTIVNADINASAAIAGTKISPNFGSQTVTASNLTLSDNDPIIQFTDANNDPDYRILVESGIWRVQDTTNGNAERLAINSSGNVGIGTTSPSRKLVLAGDTNTVASINGATNGTSSLFLGDTDDDDIGALTYNHASNFLSFTTNASEAMRIDSSGRLLIGHTTSLAGASSSSQFSLQVLGTSFATSTLNSQRYANDVSGASILLNKSRGGLGNHTIVQNNDELGKIRFYGSDGNDFDNYAAEIVARVDAAPGNNVMPGRLAFLTTSSGSSTPAERMRIDNQGRVKISGVGATISDHSVAVTQAPLYLQTATDVTQIGSSEGAATTGLFRMYDVSSSSDRYHGIELRNKSNGDIRILNQDRDTSDKGDLVIAMPKLVGGSASGCAEKIRLSGLFDSINIAGKGGAILLGPSDSGYNKQKTDVYISTVTGCTAVNTQAGDEVAGLIRFEDTGSSSNRFHGFELRNRNSGDIRILNKDVGASNKADMVFATDNGSDVTEVARFLNSGGLTFNGDTSTDNALDDYEEGTWIPTVTYSNGGGATLTEQKGFYVKIGRMVHCQCAVSASSKGGGSGHMTINGLPFTSSATTGTRHNGIMTYIAQFNAINSQPVLYNAGNVTNIFVYHLNNSGGSASAIQNVTRNNLNDTFAFRAHFMFYV